MYSYNCSNDKRYVLNKDVDSDANRFDQYELFYNNKEFIIFAKDSEEANKKAKKICDVEDKRWIL